MELVPAWIFGSKLYGLLKWVTILCFRKLHPIFTIFWARISKHEELKIFHIWFVSLLQNQMSFNLNALAGKEWLVEYLIHSQIYHSNFSDVDDLSFPVLKLQGSEEKWYVMKCIIRVLVVADTSVNVDWVCMKGLTTLLGEACNSPKHLLFSPLNQ